VVQFVAVSGPERRTHRRDTCVSEWAGVSGLVSQHRTSVGPLAIIARNSTSTSTPLPCHILKIRNGFGIAHNAA